MHCLCPRHARLWQPGPGLLFTISTASTTAQTLGSGSGQTGTITAAGSLTVSGSTVAVTITGNNETLTNLGSLLRSGTVATSATTRA
ncbi:MAG: hypothetical protein QM796_19510 [Chthoniobacteraceae bacterium]